MSRAPLLLALALLVYGCKPAATPPHVEAPPSEPPPVCALKLPKHLEHTNPDALPAAVWFELLFKDYRQGIGTDPVDCSGEPITWTPLPESCGEEEPKSPELTRRRVLTQGELITRHAGGDYWFGWAPFLTFGNGMAEGPIAIARLHEGRLEARAVGTLRAYPQRSRLDVRKLGPWHILSAEGERCGKGAECLRATRLMWLDRQRFRVRPLRSATVRNCLGPAWFPHHESLQVKLHQRWARSLQRELALAYDDAQITVDEHIAVHDRDVEQPSLPPRLFREAQAQIRITLAGGELLSEGQSLWNAIRIEDGSTETTGDPGPRAP